MKRKEALCLALAGVMALAGCAVKGPTVAGDLPSTLTVTAQLPTAYPETVTKYQAEWCNIDEQAAISVFMRREPTRREEWAQGPALYAEEDGAEEALLLLHTITPGGLIYRWETDESEEICSVCEKLRKKRPNGVDLVLQSLGSLEMEEYPQGESLSFLPYEEAQAQLEETMAACGMPPMELYFSESHTAEAMNRNREIYNSALALPENAWMTGEDGEPPIGELAAEDECYYFAYRQVQDGVPFTSAIWPRSTRSEATETSIYAIVGEEGLLEFTANGLVAVGAALEDCAIISPQEAVNVYLEEYTQAIHFENTRITGVELNYVVVKDGESYVARPAWMLTLETDKTTTGDASQPALDYVEFETLAVSADTGIILERETDTR